MRASWPGTARSLASATARAAENLLRESIARLDSIERPVLTLADPFASAAGNAVTITATGATTAARESETLARALAAPFAPSWDKSLMFAAPHTFSARVVVASGDTTVWGDLTQRFFRGWSARSFAVSTKPRRWRAAVWTDLTASVADPEESVVSLASGDGDAPELFSPLICYPSARASKMKICLSVEGEDPVTQTFDLTPVAGDMAVYVHPTLRPFALADVAEAYVIPAERPATHRCESMMAVARSLSPLSATAIADLKGTLSLTRHSSLNPASAPTAAFDIEGRIGAPLTLRNLGPAAARYTVTLTATTASGLALHLIRLRLHQCTIHNA